MQETEVNVTSAYYTSTSDDSLQKPKAPTAGFVNNKRKMLEKNAQEMLFTLGLFKYVATPFFTTISMEELKYLLNKK